MTVVVSATSVGEDLGGNAFFASSSSSVGITPLSPHGFFSAVPDVGSEPDNRVPANVPSMISISGFLYKRFMKGLDG